MTDPDLDTFLGRNPVAGRKRWIRWGIITLIVLVVLIFALRIMRPHSEAAYVQVPITRGDLDVTISATGNLAPTKQVNVGSEESGLMQKVYVSNNDQVRSGQPLASLDLSKLRDALVQSQAALQASIASVAQNQATLIQSKATLDRDEQVYKLSGGRVPAKTEIDVARGDYARAVANVAAARAQVAQNRAQVSTNQTNLAKGTIYSPVTGQVLSRQVEPGQTVAAQFNVATLFTIAEDLRQMKLEVKVDEADIGELHQGADASFTVDAYPGRTFPAKVVRVDVGANATPQINSAGTTVVPTSMVVAYTAVLSVANPDLLLKPGMTATATILATHRHNVLIVPNGALRFRPDATGAPKGGLLGGPPGQKAKPATVQRGSDQQIWTLGVDGKPRAISVIAGDTDGTNTEVSGADVKPGLKTITGKLAALAQ